MACARRQCRKAISLRTTAWKPNERIVGLYRAVEDDSERAGWRLDYETLTVTERAMKLRGTHRAGDCRPIAVPKSKVLASGQQTDSACRRLPWPPSCLPGAPVLLSPTTLTLSGPWHAMRLKASRSLMSSPMTFDLFRTFKTEVSQSFELIKMLDHGVGVHHAGLSDETVRLWSGSRNPAICASQCNINNRSGY